MFVGLFLGGLGMVFAWSCYDNFQGNQYMWKTRELKTYFTIALQTYFEQQKRETHGNYQRTLRQPIPECVFKKKQPKANFYIFFSPCICTRTCMAPCINTWHTYRFESGMQPNICSKHLVTTKHWFWHAGFLCVHFRIELTAAFMYIYIYTHIYYITLSNTCCKPIFLNDWMVGLRPMLFAPTNCWEGSWRVHSNDTTLKL